MVIEMYAYTIIRSDAKSSYYLPCAIVEVDVKSAFVGR